MDLGLMGSHGYPPGFGVVLNQKHGCSRVRKALHRFLQYRCPNQDLVDSKIFNLCLQPKEEMRYAGGQECNDLAMKNSRRPTLIDIQDIHPQSLHLGFGIASQCSRQEKILQLLESGSIDVEDGLLELSVLYDLMGPRELVADATQQPFMPYSKWCFGDESEKSLIYPERKLYINEPILGVMGEESICRENTVYPTGDDMTHILPPISDLYLSENTFKSSKRTMLVPYFERWRKGRSNTDSLKLATEKVAPLKSVVKAKAKTSQKRKTSPKTAKERNIISRSSYLHACESLLSVIVDRKKQDKTAIISLKKSSPQLTELLTEFSASIAGTGVAVILSVVCNGVPFCTTKILNTGFGLALVWLSWAVNKLRNTVISIRKSRGKLDAGEEILMDRLYRDLNDVWFRAAAVLTVAVLPLV